MLDERPLKRRFLRTHEAGRFLGLSGRTLEKHRVYGTGPAYRKVGGRVIYAIEDLEAWAEQGRQFSTSDARGTQPARRSPEQRTFPFMREAPHPAAKAP